MIYEIEYAKSALKELKKLPVETRIRLQKAIENLKSDPKKGNVRAMVGSTAWRLRVGDYRIIYDINDKKLVILILKAKHRKDVYRK